MAHVGVFLGMLRYWCFVVVSLLLLDVGKRYRIGFQPDPFEYISRAICVDCVAYLEKQTSSFEDVLMARIEGTNENNYYFVF